mmetsp:Transcript_107828/g.303829  ORF Transcript_107828/g.303829 Transcript_107828/m.303829 type:complete len:273 (+) Transcript_107828:410-1228(+)
MCVIHPVAKLVVGLDNSINVPLDQSQHRARQKAALHQAEARAMTVVDEAEAAITEQHDVPSMRVNVRQTVDEELVPMHLHERTEDGSRVTQRLQHLGARGLGTVLQEHAVDVIHHEYMPADQALALLRQDDAARNKARPAHSLVHFGQVRGLCAEVELLDVRVQCLGRRIVVLGGDERCEAEQVRYVVLEKKRHIWVLHLHDHPILLRVTRSAMLRAQHGDVDLADAGRAQGLLVEALEDLADILAHVAAEHSLNDLEGPGWHARSEWRQGS